ncbi:AP-4 complex accessory subunit RUSC1 isoform 2-T2 [Liasis olivaceus]
MQSPKKGLICNLNHVHLQHISLGLHLSRHPELQEEDSALMPSREQMGCHECHQHGGNLVPGLVDANSNNPSLPCRCCEAHAVSSEVKQGLQTQPSLTNCPTVNREEEEEEAEEEEEEEGSPSDPTSSSISSCSDLSLDESPVSVYCKPFPAKQARSPESQPNIVPLEDTQNVLSLANEEKDPNLNVHMGEHPETQVWDSPDSLYSSSSLGSSSDTSPPCPESLVESTHAGSSKAPPLVPPPVRPCRAPPAVPVVSRLGPELDSNCNALPAQEVKSNSISLGQVDINSNRAMPVGSRFGSVPPPVPPRTKRGLQGLRRSEGGKPSPEVVAPAPVEYRFHHSEPQGEASKKTITSFHELAQKRKKVSATPPVLQTKKDQSDWLIVFSPDTEMPPSHELSWGNRQETTRSLSSPVEPSNPSNGLQRGIITFKELRYRKQNSQLATKVGNPAHRRAMPGQGVPDGRAGQEMSDSEPTPSGHFWGSKEIPPRRKMSRLGLQPIVEGGSEDGADGAAKEKQLERTLETKPQARRDPDLCRKAEQGDRRIAKVRHSQSFGGVPLQGRLWRTEVDHVSTQLRQQKKALLMAVSASVDKIVAHFSSARNLVQKAQLGDSQLTPEVGYLVLNTLCPALHALVGDSLKPFQKDVITGHRPSSPWSVIEASARPGPHTRSFTELYWRVSRLAPLQSNHQRFHAFILGLLNLKQVEEWFAQLQKNSELISTLYLPTAFLLISQRFCRRWAEELLLLLQPLSVLTFQLDLLFEHRHLPLNVRPMPPQSTPSPEPGASPWEGPGLTPPDSSKPQMSSADLGFWAPSSPWQALPLPQRLLEWKDRVAGTLRGHGSPPQLRSHAQPSRDETQDKPPGWWKPLGWISSVQVSDPKEDTPLRSQWTKLRMALGEAIKEGRAVAGDAGAEPEGRPQQPIPGKNDSETEKQPSVCKGEGSAAVIPKPGMATPEAEEVYLEKTQEENSEAGSGKERWLGWLFGANSPGTPNETDSSLPRSRRPSRWLCPAIHAPTLVKKGGPAEKSWQDVGGEPNPPYPSQTYKAVRALCDYTGSEAGHLAFHKGDILQVTETVDEDWLQCFSGDCQGLVPVGYTSLIL